MSVWPIFLGIVLGLILWYVALRPLSLNEHERQRRSYGLPPKRKLPEDRKLREDHKC